MRSRRPVRRRVAEARPSRGVAAMRLPDRLARLAAALRRRLPRRVPPVVRRVRADALTYLEEAALCELAGAVRAADAAGEPGVLVEAGCALGGSALVMAASRAGGRPLLVYDVFGMPPAPTPGDGPDVHARWAEIAGGRSAGIGGGTYYGYVDGLLDRVRATFHRYGIDPARDGVQFVQGMLQDTLRPTAPVAVAHIDCDRHASVATCLERLAPWLTPRGALIIDDYDSKSGCRRAVDEFIAARGAEFQLVRRARVHVVRR